MSIFNERQLSLIKKMKTTHHLIDEKLNIFKLSIYNWDINKAIKYYHQDSFCIDHFFDSCNMTAKLPETKKSESELSTSNSIDGVGVCHLEHKYHFYTLWNFYDDIKMCELLCKYLLYTNKYKHNANLYCYYAHILKFQTKTDDDRLQCEQFFLKAISLNDQFADAHCGYAMFIDRFRYDNKKADKHFEIACSIENDPNIHIFCLNYCMTVYRRKNRFNANKNECLNKALRYVSKGLEYKPNDAILLHWAAKILYQLNKLVDAVKYLEKAFALSNNYTFDEKKTFTTRYIITKLRLLDNQFKTKENCKCKEIDNININNIDQNGKEFKDKEDDDIKEWETNRRYNGKSWNKLSEISYFDEIESHRNNAILDSKDKIEKLICGYIRLNTKYDFTMINKIVQNYFGGPCNQCIFKCIANANIGINNTHSKNYMYTCTNSNHLGHLSRTIIFNTPLLKLVNGKFYSGKGDEAMIDTRSETAYTIDLKFVESKICNYLSKNYSSFKLNFGFQIGLVQLNLHQLDKLREFKNCLNYNMMNICIPDLVVLYWPAIERITGARFEFDENSNCFIQTNRFESKGYVEPGTDGLTRNNKDNNNDNNNVNAWEIPNIDISIDNSSVINSGKKVTINPDKDKIEFGIRIFKENVVNVRGGLDLDTENFSFDTVMKKNDILFNLTDGSYNLSIAKQHYNKRNLVWLPTVTCVSCNCRDKSNQGLILRVG